MSESSSATSSPAARSSQIGRYGTLSLMKQNETDGVVTAFGIDSEVLTFGRDLESGIRLFYSDVSPLHCKVTFEERKAFLVVLGTSGVVVDGCKVYPNQSSSSPTTIPLPNNSEFEIHGKRFRFTYPPKELRAQLYASPSKSKRRALRLSMIQSAQVFSPRPSPNPAENLRILQSPLKPFKSASPSPFASPSPATSGGGRAPLFTAALTTVPDSDEEIILVQGSCPRVVEEDKDLVILEDVEVSATTSSSGRPSSPTKSAYGQAPPPTQLLQMQPPKPPKTPPRNVGRPSLHRAVLIRSAHKAVLKAETDREDQEEEMEVLGALADDDEEGDDSEESLSFEEDCEQGEAAQEDREGEEANEQDEGGEDEQRPFWRKSLGNMWPFRRSTSPTKPTDESEAGQPSVPTETVSKDLSMVLEDEDDVDPDSEEANENLAPLRTGAAAVPGLGAPLNHRRFPNSISPSKPSTSSSSKPGSGPFMTPQSTRTQPTHAQTGRQPGRFSLAPRPSLNGDGPRRIKIEETPWKVQDIMLQDPASSAGQPKQAVPGTPDTHTRRPVRGWTPGTGAAMPLSEEEQRAIRERRRSALTMPETFFGGSGGVPGLGSPRKEREMDKKAESGSGSGYERMSTSPSKSRTTFSAGATGASGVSGGDEDEEVDTMTLLGKMLEKVESMKDMKERRASLAAMSPQKKKEKEGLFGPSGSSGSSSSDSVSSMSASGSSTSLSSGTEPVTGLDPGHDDDDDDKENFTNPTYLGGESDSEPFSLLRTPNKREAYIPRRSLYVLEKPSSGTTTTTTVTSSSNAKDNDVVMTDAAAPTPSTNTVAAPPPPPPSVLSPLKTRTGRKVQNSSSKSRLAMANTPSFADEASPAINSMMKDGAESDEEQQEKNDKTKKMVMSGRIPKQGEDNDEDADEMNIDADGDNDVDVSTTQTKSATKRSGSLKPPSTSKSRKPPSTTTTTTRTRSKTPSRGTPGSSKPPSSNSNSTVVEPTVHDEASGSSTTTTTLKLTRGRAPRSKTPVRSEAESESTVKKSTTTTRRGGGKKASAEPSATTDDESSVPAPKKRGRKPATPKPDEEDSSTTTTKPKTRHGRSRAGVASETEEEDEDGAGDEIQVVAVKPKRGRPRKGNVTATAAAVPDPIKEEDTDALTPSAALAPSKKTTSATAAPRSRSKGSAIPTSKARVTRKTATSTAPEEEGQTDPDVDKENNDSQDEVVITKTTRGRPKKAQGAAKEVKEEVMTEPELGTTAKRTTRATRARTRT
ncbi:hypothetical protein D9758_010813 [Tetrapyrgos nigripes]|uniref:FHA domain-containing protein n=1 Tax=Tetrapyrgos nigripes TaxID=182062 RepID=A0A8H5GIJ3_9AGAR|nr:hypothetical protein D9758_010813 [Tetrapyrgos nigripes]